MKTKKQMDKLISDAKTVFEQNPQTMRVYRNIDENLFLKIKRTSIDVLFRKKIKGRIIELSLGNYLNLSIYRRYKRKICRDTTVPKSR